ncbi:preprotein translocase subunit SecG [Flavobacterium aurantiibacter]|uniref:Protein-export membrane protein SecG n=1 Tax=Flavobacterium aurantiibacter TaxID=2023067 RepID=A0A255ZGS1_9FLAO|nr:preprotein translocase subunit SecG [Flavobacterium aurantiibacter]OYQ40631.1 preprotein translocase subunit SecG [Flavobacterium aurantiibacter]
MFSIFVVSITIVCFLLILVIMVQNPKGGGLSSTLGSSAQLGGVQKTTDFLDKSTWTLGTALILLVLLSSISFSKPEAEQVALPEATEAPAAPAANENKPAAEKPSTTTTTNTPVEVPVKK